jgi:PKHD-type hydroxylase
MKGEWCYFKSYFSKEYCEEILERSKDLQFQSGFLGESGKTENNNYRKSNIAWVYPDQFSDIYDELWKLEKIANEEWFNFDVNNLEYIQLAEYKSEEGAEYKRHQDVFWINSSEKHRKLTAVVQLSDPNDYDGGDLQLFECNEYPNSNEIKEQGSVIFFPSFIYHQLNPVTEGTRHSLVAWFEGPKWR